jgi:hypothetical protein
MNEQPPSGNRWEQPDDTAPVQPPVPPSHPTPTTPPAEPTYSAPAESRRWPSWARATRVKLGAVGAAIFLLGGGAGYGLAHATTDDSTLPNRGPGPGFGDGSRIDRHGFGNQDGQDGQQQGQQPGTGDGSGT